MEKEELLQKVKGLFGQAEFLDVFKYEHFVWEEQGEKMEDKGINMSSYPSEIYFLTVIDESNLQTTIKLVKR